MYKSEFTDHELWHAIALDDARAFTTFYDRHWRGVYKTALYYLHDVEMAEQLLQNIFVTLWNRRKHLQINNFRAYFIVVTRYHVFSYLRAKKVNPVVYLENYDNEDKISLRNEAEDHFELQDLKQSLSDQLAGLPKRCREIFWLSRIDQLNNDEIAQQLGVSKRTVENQLAIAVKYLKDADAASALWGLLILINCALLICDRL